ncbi:LysR family transcriptional regulator substrate-binding protein [Paenibacillus rhizoplanae]
MNELDQPCGTIRIRTQESFFLTRMLPFVQEYIRNYPNVNLRIEQGSYQDILNGVLDYELDFGIVPQDPNRQDILFIQLWRRRLFFLLHLRI